MSKFKYFVMLACGMLCGLPALAEGESGGNSTITAVNAAVSSWVTQAKSSVEGWIETLGPLFLVGLGIVLLLLAWALFKKVTNKAKG